MNKNSGKSEKKNKGNFAKTLREFISFSFVGATSIVVQWGGYLLLLLVGEKIANLPQATVINAANIIAFILAVVNSYIWNTVFVFKPDKKDIKQAESEYPETPETKPEQQRKGFNHGKGFARMIITNIGYLILSTLLLNFFVYVVNISEKIAPILYIILLTPYSFFVTKFWVYKK